MLERKETSEEDSVRGNSRIDNNLGWVSYDTSSSLSPEMAEIISLIERIVQAKISDVLKENEQLKELLQKKDDRIDSLSKDNQYLQKATISLTIQNQQMLEHHKNNKEAQALKDDNESASSFSDYDFKYDATNFGLAEAMAIDSIFLKLQSLAQKKDVYGNYYVDCASAIIPIFITITTDERIDRKYRYKGSLKSFCKEWNCNVAAFIPDEKRSKELTCDYNSIKAIINKAPFKDSSIASWQRMFDEGKNKTILLRAINIKVQMEKLFAKY